MWEIPAEALSTGGAVGLLGVVVLMVLTGKLVPQATHNRIVEDRDNQITFLRQENAAKAEEAKIRTEQVNKLMSNSDLSLAILSSIAKTAGRDADVAS